MGVTWVTGSVGEMGETGVFGACSDDGLDGPCSRMGGNSSPGVKVLELKGGAISGCFLGRTRKDRACLEEALRSSMLDCSVGDAREQARSLVGGLDKVTVA